MHVIRDVLGTHITLRITTRAFHFIAAILLDERFLTFIAFPHKGLCHGFFDDVLR